MRSRTTGLILIMAALVAALAVGLFFRWRGPAATLSFEVRDAASASWVWDSTIRLQDRFLRGFYATSFHFTHLRPGTFEMSVTAPNYQPASVRIRIRPGSNTIPPVSLVGLEIPGFSRFTVSAGRGARGLELKLNPLNAQGDLIKAFPCIDVRIMASVSVQVKGGSPVLAPTAEGAERGTRLFQGEAAWTWDPAPDAVYRYDAVLSRIPPEAAPYLVIDYAVLIPDPRRISSQDVDGLVNGFLQLRDPGALAGYLRPYRDKVRLESGTVWNVRNAAGS